MNPEWIGFLAALLTTIAYIPQTVKVIKTRDTRSISLGMYATISCGIFRWLVYGVLIGSASLIVCNGLTLVMALVILVMKLRHG